MTTPARHLLALAALAALTACSDPLKQVPRLSEVDLAEPASPVEAAIIASQQEREAPSLMARLFGGGAAPAPAETQAADAPATKAAPPAPKRPRGLAGLFARRSAPADTAAPAQTAQTTERPAATGGLLASLFAPGGAPGGRASSPDAQPAALRAPTRQMPRASSGPDARDVTLGDPVPFGQIARICEVPKRQMGRRIGKKAGLELWDSFPQSTAPRPFYITGFSDRCPRVITGALAMFGDARLHETHRYSSRAPYSDVDTAYERAKSSVCRVPRGQPCGNALARLERRVALVTSYEHFGSAGSATVLIDNKSVKAVARDR